MNRHLFLIGMMGCGKSTLGALLSRELRAPLLDLDAEIERFEGRSIPAIFADVGDAGFRIAETAALRRACGGSPCIVATGGGIVTREENILLMRESGLVVFLCRPSGCARSTRSARRSTAAPRTCALTTPPRRSRPRGRSRRLRR